MQIDAHPADPGDFYAHIKGDEFQAAVRDNTEFAFALFHELTADSGNIVFSPQNLSTTFSWLSAGARGETQNEIRKAMHTNLSDESLHTTIAGLNNHLYRLARTENAEFQSEASLWVKTITDCLRGGLVGAGFPVGAPRTAFTEIMAPKAPRL